MKLLYVCTTYYNPTDSAIRRKLFDDFVTRMGYESQVVLRTVSMLPRHIDMRVPDQWVPSSDSPLWYKENLLNYLFKRLPVGAKYVAWIDADVAFANPAWVAQTIATLDDGLDVVQLFSEAVDLAKDNSIQVPKGVRPGIVSAVKQVLQVPSCPGFAWAATRTWLDKVGGLCDATPVTTAADSHMASILLGLPAFKATDLPKDYTQPWERWAYNLPVTACECVDGLLLHYWHGDRQDRGYTEQWDVVRRHYRASDLERNRDGIWQFKDLNCSMAREMKMIQERRG